MSFDNPYFPQTFDIGTPGAGHMHFASDGSQTLYGPDGVTVLFSLDPTNGMQAFKGKVRGPIFETIPLGGANPTGFIRIGDANQPDYVEFWPPGFTPLTPPFAHATHAVVNGQDVSAFELNAGWTGPANSGVQSRLTLQPGSDARPQDGIASLDTHNNGAFAAGVQVQANGNIYLLVGTNSVLFDGSILQSPRAIAGALPGVQTLPTNNVFAAIGQAGNPSSGPGNTGLARLLWGGNTNVVLDGGVLPASPWSAWLQVGDSTNAAGHYVLGLQPNGGGLHVAGAVMNGMNVAHFEVRNPAGDTSNVTMALGAVTSQSGDIISVKDANNVNIFSLFAPQADGKTAIVLKAGTADQGAIAGYGQLYVVNGALKYRGGSGTITTIAAA